jgi:hypothetical protein
MGRDAEVIERRLAFAVSWSTAQGGNLSVDGLKEPRGGILVDDLDLEIPEALLSLRHFAYNCLREALRIPLDHINHIESP